jgi:hypothetical protein
MLSLGLFVTWRLWWYRGEVALETPGHQDQNVNEWFYAHAVRSLVRGENPLHATSLNVPDGVNMMANTSMLLLSFLLIPVTLLFGPHITYATVLWLGLGLTGIGWYAFLRRHVVQSPWAALLGGLLCGFGPGISSHAGAHPNFAVQFMLPVIAHYAFSLASPLPGQRIRTQVKLGLAIVAQFFIGEEMLFHTAFACALFCVVYAIAFRKEARAIAPRFLRDLALTALPVGALLAYPIYYQFRGPGSYGELFAHANWDGADLLGVFCYPTRSLGGVVGRGQPLFINSVEENTFYSLPLLVFLALGAWLRREDKLVRTAAITALVLVVFALGPELRLASQNTHVPLPWRLFVNRPVLQAAIPGRFGLGALAVLGVLFARLCDAVLKQPKESRTGWIVGITCVLFPLMPLPLRVERREPVPAFFADRTWRQFVKDDETVVPVPLPHWDTDPMHWLALSNNEMSMPRGYFIGPGDHGQGALSPPYRYLDAILDGVRYTRQVPTLTEENKQWAHNDLRHWRAGVVVLTPCAAHAELLQVLEQVLGPPQAGHGVLYWDLP